MGELQIGDEIRVVAPSQGWEDMNQEHYSRAQDMIERHGFAVTYGHNVTDLGLHHTGFTGARAQDINQAFADPDVKAIIALRGGSSASEVLPHIDWDTVVENPKPLIGFSDITALLNGVRAQTDQNAYYGPTFSTLGDARFGRDALRHLLDVLRGDPVQLAPTAAWGVPRREGLNFENSMTVVQEGQARGQIVGGHLGTLVASHGTDFAPSYGEEASKEPFILAIDHNEEHGRHNGREFARLLESVIQQPGTLGNMRGILIGRFTPGSEIPSDELAAIIAAKGLIRMPVVANVDFGHTLPMYTLPLGGQATMEVEGDRAFVTVQATPMSAER